jgi:hypothetical protein
MCTFLSVSWAIKWDYNHWCKLWISFTVLTPLWDFVFMIYQCHYCKRSLISCLNDNDTADVPLALQISVGLTVDERYEKKNICDNLQKVYQKPSVLTANAENFAILFEWTQDNCRRPCLASRLFAGNSDTPTHNFWRSARVSKAANIWDFKQLPPLSISDLMSPYQNLCNYLTTESLSLKFHHQVIDRCYRHFPQRWGNTHVPFPVFQYVINLSVYPSTEIQVLLKCSDGEPFEITYFYMAWFLF